MNVCVLVFSATNVIGDVCGMDVMINNNKVSVISIYIHPNKSLNDIKIFILHNLLPYTTNMAQINPILASTNCSTIPMILAGDFNLDISKPENSQFLEFMEHNFNLKLSSSTASTTMGNSCIDMVFSRYINLNCHTYLTYFSYHKPILIKIQ